MRVIYCSSSTGNDQRQGDHICSPSTLVLSYHLSRPVPSYVVYRTYSFRVILLSYAYVITLPCLLSSGGLLSVYSARLRPSVIYAVLMICGKRRIVICRTIPWLRHLKASVPRGPGSSSPVASVVSSSALLLSPRSPIPVIYRNKLFNEGLWLHRYTFSNKKKFIITIFLTLQSLNMRTNSIPFFFFFLIRPYMLAPTLINHLTLRFNYQLTTDFMTSYTNFNKCKF